MKLTPVSILICLTCNTEEQIAMCFKVNNDPNWETYFGQKMKIFSFNLYPILVFKNEFFRKLVTTS